MSIVGDLQRSMAEELEAESRYKRRAIGADSVTKNLFLHIANEEHGHYLELKHFMGLRPELRLAVDVELRKERRNKSCRI